VVASALRVTCSTAASVPRPNDQSVVPTVITVPPDSPKGRVSTITALPCFTRRIFAGVTAP
jgi:hypothetical protein